MRKAALFLCLILTAGHVPPALAGEISVTLSVDRDEATLADSLRLTVSVEGKRKIDTPPVIRGLESFTVATGGTSSRVNIVNSRVSSSVDYTYFIQPKSTGRFEIGPAEVKVKGEVYRSAVAAVTVVESAGPDEGDRGSIFLKATLRRDRIYAGEETLYTLRLYRLVRVSDISADLPESDAVGFRQYGNPREYRGVFEGRTYDIIEVRYVVQPQRPGTYALAPAMMRMTVYPKHGRSRRGLFDSPFFTTGQPKSAVSEPLELTVRALPEEGRPPDFSGLVGNFGIAAVMDPPAVTAGESATLTVTVSGQGNVTRIPDLELPGVEGLKIYSDEPALEVQQEEEWVKGAKIMKWALVPERAGEFALSPVGVSYFDTRQERYRSVRTPPLTLKANPGEARSEPVAGAASPGGEHADVVPQAVREIGRDILPVHTSMSALTSALPGMPRGGGILIVLAAPAGVFFLALGGIRLGRKSAASEAAARSRKAARECLRRCRREGGDPQALMKYFQEYLNDRFTLSLGALTPEEAEEVLRGQGVSEETAAEVRDRLRDLVNAVYAGGGREEGAAGESLARLVGRIEKEAR